MINVLVTTAGSASGVNCITALKSQEELDVNIIASDFSEYGAGLHLADSYFTTPPFSNEKEYIRKVVKICEDEKVDVVLPVFSNDVYIFSKYEYELKSSGLKFFIPPFETVNLLRDKWLAYKFYQKNEIPTPKTHKFDQKKPVEFPIFVKPIIGSGSKKSFLIKTQNELDFYWKSLKSGKFIFQTYIGAPEFTVDILIGNHNKILGLVARQRLKTKNGLAIVSRTVDSKVITPLVERLITKIDLKGPLNLQYFLLPNQEPMVIEINTRFAAGGLPLTIKSGINLPLETIKLALGLSPTPLEGYEPGLTMIRYYSEVFV
ncbi:MAG: ATP-grasp domain-containing protein [Bacteroidetes bacterium]|nr:MAG: ATP-grasp domain-containing protein [Bacteroidota bacterium]